MRKNVFSKTSVVVAGLGALVFALTFLGTSSGKIPGIWQLPLVSTAGHGYVPGYELEEGGQLMMIYFGRASCAWSNGDELPGLIERIKVSLAEQAAASDRRFVAVGVALDWSTREGSRYLRRFGVFDEISAGNSWLNSLATKYMWGEEPGPGATPQVVVVECSLAVTGSERAVESRLWVGDERLLVRKVGVDEISRWVADGAPLSASETAASMPASGAAEFTR